MVEKHQFDGLIVAELDDRVVINGPARVVRVCEDDTPVLYIYKHIGTSVLVKPWNTLQPGRS